ncbi:metalloregulator ArsR/SmtB family transcription factor [Brevibacillus sp. SYP-B805]|uniref:metalloregulator ArsR/SmtB family transcription factor n=1 Tax=Brevibacillus sp. SYP-B805 TaxID=1578199 RepID=UPI0013EB8A38|nr:metalloregulator ArsR/SmtB family transcription factor [Brevibacillus sp. SYP-B805]
MQLQRIVNFYKTLGDPTRIRILALLAKGPLHGQALAGKLGVTPPTITHHMVKLREVGLIYERREKNTIYFYLNDKSLKRDVQAILDVVFKGEGLLEEHGEEGRSMSALEAERAAVIQNFFTVDGKLKQIPAQRKKKLFVFEHMLKGLKQGRKYPEKELNEYIKQFHDDYATIRREFVMNHYMYRENGVYELNPREMWAKPEELK